MGDFAVQFLICNILVSLIAGALLAAKRLLQKRLTGRMQYFLWFPFLGLLAVPFLPLEALPLFSWQRSLGQVPAQGLAAAMAKTAAPAPAGALGWMEDFAMTVSQQAPSCIGLLLFALWIGGIAAMTALTLYSALRFHVLKKSALPLENPGLGRLYQHCLLELGILRPLPIYTTAFLTSPVIAGLFRPCIYLPLHVISGCPAKKLRYMLLHELFHYRHRDYAANYLMHMARVLYWFNPAVWYALREMKTDREIACDAAVLKMLDADAYEDYGTTLIDLAEKVSCSPFPFAIGINGGMAQMKRRILHIARYERASRKKVISGAIACILIAALLVGSVPFLTIRAAGRSRYQFQEQGKTITSLDLTDFFGQNEGCFVLYDVQDDAWQIYNQELAELRAAPVSTYKIYSALLGLEAGIISPEASLLSWDGRQYGLSQWNGDQDLRSAMQHSVNWYFQEIDRQAGLSSIRDFIEGIGYGNRRVGGDIAAYWADSSLCISPVEQVEMLERFYYNQFGFSPENIEAVKASLFLYTEGRSAIYGKTGTGNADGQNILGWFLGFVEQEGRTYFFATYIQDGALASGSAAAELTLSILSSLGVLNYSSIDFFLHK